MPQGSPISPLLSNIILDVLDKEFVRKGYRFVRYADDFSIYTKSKAEAKRIGNEVYLFLKDKLKLPINKETPEHGSEKGAHEVPESEDLATLSCWVTDLYPLTRKAIKRAERKEIFQWKILVKSQLAGEVLVAKKSSWGSLKRKLKGITKKTRPYKFEERLKKLAEICRGWVNNYRLASIQAKLKALDEWLRNRLRNCIWSRKLSAFFKGRIILVI